MPILFRTLRICSFFQKVRQAAAYGFGVMGMNGGSIYARACAEALPRLFTMINTPNSRTIENNTATENAISAVTKILKYNNSCVDNLDQVSLKKKKPMITKRTFYFSCSFIKFGYLGFQFMKIQKKHLISMVIYVI